MRKLSYIIIIAGVLLLLYPKASEWFEDWQQQKLLEEAERNFEQGTNTAQTSVDPDLRLKYAKVTQLLADESVLGEESESADNNGASDAGEQAIGLIEIDTIDAKLPVLEGATKANMRHSAVHLTETAPLGEVGNAAIAAHRAHTKGRLFNRLNEVKIGDTITVKTRGKVYNYIVYDIQIVDPTDISVLEGNKKDRILTLITCDPLINPTHRLIVHAKLP